MRPVQPARKLRNDGWSAPAFSTGRLHCLCSGETLVEKRGLVGVEVCESEGLRQLGLQAGYGAPGVNLDGSASMLLMTKTYVRASPKPDVADGTMRTRIIKIYMCKGVYTSFFIF